MSSEQSTLVLESSVLTSRKSNKSSEYRHFCLILLIVSTQLYTLHWSAMSMITTAFQPFLYQRWHMTLFGPVLVVCSNQLCFNHMDFVIPTYTYSSYSLWLVPLFCLSLAIHLLADWLYNISPGSVLYRRDLLIFCVHFSCYSRIFSPSINTCLDLKKKD